MEQATNHSKSGLQNLAANASYHGGPDYNLGGAAASFNHHPHSGNPSFYNGGHHNPAASAYGQVYYTVNSHGNQSFDAGTDYNFRKRGFEDVNDFFGDVKRHRMSTSYNDASGRLAALSGIAPYLSGNSGYGGGSMDSYPSNGGGVMSSFESGGGSNGGGGAGVATHQQYSLPQPVPQMGNARTKNDLTQIDAFLQDMQANIYEHPVQAAAAGVQQPGIHAMHSAMNFRSAESPPAMQQNVSSTPGGGGQAMTAHALAHLANPHTAAGAAATHLSPGSAHSLDTPALTPSSSITTTSWGGQSNSPGPSHRSHSASVSTVASATPASLNPNAATLYPVLPSVPAMSDLSSGTTGMSYPTTSAPASGLAPAFEDGLGRRYSGGRLQRAAPAPALRGGGNDDADAYMDDVATPRAFKNPLAADGKLDSALLDRSALRSPSAESMSGSEDSAADREQEMWVESIRVVEALRDYIQQRLENGEYEISEQDVDDDADMSGMDGVNREMEMMGESEVLYPKLAVA